MAKLRVFGRYQFLVMGFALFAGACGGNEAEDETGNPETGGKTGANGVPEGWCQSIEDAPFERFTIPTFEYEEETFEMEPLRGIFDGGYVALEPINDEFFEIHATPKILQVAFDAKGEISGIKPRILDPEIANYDPHAVGDFNGDGLKRDLVHLEKDEEGNLQLVFRVEEDGGTLSNLATVKIIADFQRDEWADDLTESATDIYVFDFNDDSIDDIVTVYGNDSDDVPYLVVLFQSEDSSWTETVVGEMEYHDGYRYEKFFDIDFDGDIDLEFETRGADVYFFENQGNGTFTMETLEEAKIGDYSTLFDMDGDGYADMLRNQGCWTSGNPDDNLKETCIDSEIAGESGTFLENYNWTDIDSDGDVDLAFSDSDSFADDEYGNGIVSHRFALVRNDGANNFEDSPFWCGPENMVHIHGYEINGDGQPDVGVFMRDEPYFWLLLSK